MALFIDGCISGVEDLTAQDSQLLNVASVEGIDVTQKSALAQEELAMELTTLLTRLSHAGRFPWMAPAPSVGSVVVTPALRLWHTFRVLEMVYSEAYNGQLNDRYAGKRDQFHDQVKVARERLIQTGVGIAAYPVPQASTPNLIPAAGGLPDNTYYVTVAWTNSKGEEGAPAVPAAISTSGSTFVAQPGAAPEIATGWNVYAGTDPAAMTLQNGAAIGMDRTWTEPDALVTGGRAPGRGQPPTYLKPVPRMIQRG